MKTLKRIGLFLLYKFIEIFIYSLPFFLGILIIKLIPYLAWNIKDYSIILSILYAYIIGFLGLMLLVLLYEFVISS